MRVFIGTKAWISRLLIASSVPAQAVDKALAQAEIVFSEATMEELANVLSRDKWDRYVLNEDRQVFIRHLLHVATMVPVFAEIIDCRDPKDNQFLALALDAGADCIVSGDQDLLVLHPWRGVDIVTPAGFLTMEN